MAFVLTLSICLVSAPLRTADAATVAAPGAAAPTPVATVSPPRPILVAPPPASAPPDAIPPPAPVAPPSGAPAQVPAPVPQAVTEKIGQGDRYFLEHDYRAALFAYQDAVYLAPGHAPARVRLGRAYLSLRYPERAAEQAERALALDPTSAEARKLLEEARTSPSRPPLPAAPVREAPREPVARDPGPATTVAAQPRVYRFTPDPDPREERVGSAVADAQVAPAAPPVPVQPAAQEAAPAPSAADRYRAAVVMLGNREFEKAVAELTEAIAADPRLAVAYAARASARFGLGRYREAADDYAAALGLDPALSTPLYGLAECYRVLGDPAKASDMYRRYSASSAPDVREELREIAAKRAEELR